MSGVETLGRVLPVVAPRQRRGWLRRALRTGPLVCGSAILALVVVIALVAPILFPGNPNDMVDVPAQWPGESAATPLGTDSMGRDVAAGLAYGARVSLLVGISSAVIGLLIGTTVGAIGGYFGGWTDRILARLTIIFQTIPSFLLVIVIVTIATPSAAIIALAIGVASWPTVARLVRAQYRSLRAQDFVMAARSLGYSAPRIIVCEILPNALPPIVVTTSVMVANAILIEAGLSFLNLGDANLISWGSMIGDGRALLRTAWFLTALPGSAIALTVLSLNLIGDGLNEVLNPRAGKE